MVVEPGRREGGPVHRSTQEGCRQHGINPSSFPGGPLSKNREGLNPERDLVLRPLPAQGSGAAATTWAHGVTPVGKEGRGGCGGDSPSSACAAVESHPGSASSCS